MDLWRLGNTAGYLQNEQEIKDDRLITRVSYSTCILLGGYICGGLFQSLFWHKLFKQIFEDSQVLKKAKTHQRVKLKCIRLD